MTNQTNKLTGLEIAVIGMAGRFPGAANIDQFWHNLSSGTESITFFTPGELTEAGIDPALANHPDYVPAKGIVAGKHQFDCSFFGYTPKEAGTMDPQMRILHEVCWSALEHAGYVPDGYSGLIGLYAGAGMNFFWEAHTLVSGKNEEVGGFEAAMLNNKDFLCTRISYKLNLRGPSFTVHTACSTSLVAVHLAARAVLTGECGMALAGGVAAVFPDQHGYMYQEGMINSKDGHCRTFDAECSGTVFGEGAGIVVLKRLSQALADRDTVHAVIKGSAMNNDGSRKAGYTAPSTGGEAEVIRRALKVSKIPADSISYIEAHGTGTPMGDTMETDAIRQAFDVEQKNYCAVGSVKTNIGHLDAAAGIAGFIKTVLSIYNKKIPPSLHFNAPNPNINFADSPFFVNTKLLDWSNDRYPLRAGVNGFGIGGTNAHVILEEAPPEPNEETETGSEQLLVLSARTGEALDRMTANLADYFETNPGLSLADTAYTLQTGRKAFKFRRAAVCGDTGEAVEKLRAPADSGLIHSAEAGDSNRPLVFMFAGLGSQHVNMARDLYESLPRFRDTMDRCFNQLAKDGYGLKEILYPVNKENTAIIDSIDMAQLSVFCVEYALAEFFVYWGLEPKVMIGYSFGEYAAACLSGVFSLEDALQLIAERCRLMASLSIGAMTSVPLPRPEVEELLSESPGVSFCIDNGPSCIVGGTIRDIEVFEKQMKQRRMMCMRLSATRAVHSAMMDPVLEDFKIAAASITLNEPRIPYISNVTGSEALEADTVSPSYWARHLREPVRFSEGIERLIQTKDAIFIEIGPGRDLSTLISRSLRREDNQCSINLLPNANDAFSSYSYLLTKTGFLWLQGKLPDWKAFYGETLRKLRKRIPLPTYPFEELSFRVKNEELDFSAASKKSSGQILKNPDSAQWFYLPAWNPSLVPPVNDYDPGESVCLIFTGKDLLDGIVPALREKFKRVFTVTPADVSQMEAAGEDSRRINPADRQHYLDLFAGLKQDGAMPHRIIHAWNVEQDEPGTREITAQTVEHQLAHGFFSLLYTVQAFNKNSRGNSLHIDVVTTGLREVAFEGVGHPVKGTVPGLLKVIPQEHANIRCRSIDIDSYSASPMLIDEFILNARSMALDPNIAYRQNRRFAQDYIPARMEAVEPGAEKKLPFKTNGVYLITGGMGGMGLSLAQMLAQHYRAKLVLTGRSPLPPREQWEQIPDTGGNWKKIQKLLHLESLGAEVMTAAADAGNYNDMLSVFEEAEKKFGPINGVIHAAGVQSGPSFSGLNDLTEDACRQQFNSKLHGLLVLDNILEHCRVDFCIIASSIASVLGGVAFGAYAAANSFIDAYIAWKGTGSAVPWSCVNWDTWIFNEDILINGIPQGQLAMTPDEGVQSFLRILSRPGTRQVVHSLGNLHERIDRWVKMDIIEDDEDDDIDTGGKPGSTVHYYPRPDLMNAYVEPVSDIEKTVAAIWRKMFGFEKIGIEDNFFELGGDSLKVLTMTAKVHKRLEVEIPVPDFFRDPTIRGISELAKDAETSVYSMVAPMETREYYPLTPAQKRLYVIQQIEKHSTGYNEYMLFNLKGNLDTEQLRKAFNKIIERHESLRTSFHVINKETVQKVHRSEDVEFELQELNIDTSILSEGEVLKKFRRAFDLSVPPLFRASLIDTGSSNYILNIEMHHIISDGLSYQIFTREFFALYMGIDNLPGMTLHYKDYALWLNSPAQLKRMAGQEDYWLDRFDGDIPVLKLPYDFPRPDTMTYDGNALNFSFDAETGAALRQIVREEEVTLFMLLIALFFVWMSKLSRQEDIVAGTPILGRNQEELHQIIGMFVNTLAIRSFPKGESAFTEYLHHLKQIVLDAFANQDYPFEDLTDKRAGHRNAGRNPIFDTIFTLQNAAASDTLEPAPQAPQAQPDIAMDMYPSNQLQHAQFDLLLFAHESRDSVGFRLVYRTQLFKPETVERFITYFREITAAVVENPGIKLNDIKLSHELQAAQLEIPDTDFDF